MQSNHLFVVLKRGPFLKDSGLRTQDSGLAGLKGRGGFTLLEVLVASTILSLMLAALYGVFSQTLTSKKIAEERLNRSRAVRLVLLRLGEELQSSLALSPLNARFVGHTRYEGLLPQARLSFVAALPTPLTAGGAAPIEIHYWLSPDPKQPRLFSLVR